MRFYTQRTQLLSLSTSCNTRIRNQTDTLSDSITTLLNKVSSNKCSNKEVKEGLAQLDIVINTAKIVIFWIVLVGNTSFEERLSSPVCQKMPQQAPSKL